MVHSSPSLPLRHAAEPQTPTRRAALPYHGADDIEDDTIPCSPGALLAQGRETTTVTQPTQIVRRPSSPGILASSSPAASVIEVPASSPFQKRDAFPKSKLGSRLAPAGTLFRPPAARPKPLSPERKRPAAEPINLISDDDDEDDNDRLEPPRGDIRPTDFKAHISSFVYKPRVEQEQTTKRMRQIYDVFGDRFPSEKVREALRECDNDLEDAIAWLERAAKQTGRKLVSKAALREARPAVTPSPPKQPKQPKRRLVQGLRQRRESSPVQELPEEPEEEEPEEPEVINLVEDKEDEYKAELSPSPTEDEDGRVLQSINNSTLRELAAMTGMKESLLEPIIGSRPFHDLHEARKLSVNKKPGSRKSARVSIGETVVDAVEVFLNAVDAIDEVVATCEAKAQAVKSVMDTWDLDCFGHPKRSGRESPNAEAPPTPSSLREGSRYTSPLVPRQPALMDGHCKMKPFQMFGLNWMTLLNNYDIGCILADEMGLGKTCQVISFICQLVESDAPRERRPWPNLIVVPPSTYNNWLGEFEKFAPGLSVIGYRGSQMERAEIAYQVEQEPEAYHVVLATYSQINSEADVEAMQSFRLNAAIFDEGHKMKNPETKSYRDLRRIPAAWKMLLTGTPVQNNLLEMTSLLNFINPQMFDGYMEHIQYIFSQKVTIRDVSNGAFLYSERVKRARTILEPFILQRRKDQVLADLPQKICSVVQCDMTAPQKETYNEYEELFKMEPSLRGARAKGRQNDQNNVWMQLRKAALHPLLFRRHFTDAKVEEMAKILMDRIPQSELHQPDIKHLIQELKNSSDFELHLWCRDYPPLLKQFDILPEMTLDSGKVQKMLQLIRQYQDNGDRVLIFSKFSRLIELLREVLALRDIEHLVLTGATSVSERQDLIDEFNTDASIPVFLLTTGAGGTGINLTSANKIIIFDQSDNPQDDIQAENRAHRLGQTRDVEVIRLIASGTIEELIYKACQKKIQLANRVTGAEEEEGDDNMEQQVRRMMEEQMTPP